MQKKQFTLGVDVSKRTLDIHCAELNAHIKIDNDSKGFKALESFCKTNQIKYSNTVVILEYTGGYEYRFLHYCLAKNLNYVRVSGLAIKRSMGIVRGKTDKIDSARIAQFGIEKYRSLEISKPLNTSILNLKELLGFRKKLIRENASYKKQIAERKHIHQANNQEIIIKILTQKLKTNTTQIIEIETAINTLIESNTAFVKSFDLLCSVRGIGKINAWMTIAYTENFSAFKDARAYAVYVGVVPFEHSSGSSIRGKTRVSHMANKELKQELTQAARSAIQWDTETKLYAERKLGSKHYMVVLNNVKFKLILRMFAVVKRGVKYVDKYKNVA
jgi:transposase